MRSTMQDFPLTIRSIMQHGTTVHAGSQVVTATAEGTRSRTYGEMAPRIAQLAHGLRGLGITGDQRVGTFMWNNAEHLEAYLAVPSMGAVMHTLTLRLFPEQLVYVANHAEDRVIVVDDSLIPLLAPQLPKLTTVTHVVVNAPGAAPDLSPLADSGKEVLLYEDLLAGQPTTFEWPDVDERDAAAMCYTSGTTGNPKGVVYSHRSEYLHSLMCCSAATVGLTSKDRILPIVPMFHANAWGLPYAALLSGASMMMPDRFLQAEPLCRFIQATQPTVSGAVPTVWNDVLNHLDAHPEIKIGSLRRIAVGGSAVSRALQEAMETRHGLDIVQAWGMTETSPIATVAEVPEGVTGEDVWPHRTAQGRIVAGVEARIVDDEGTVLPWDGESVGEVEVRGPWITGSYYNSDDPEVDQRFDDGWLRTGDVGHLDARGTLRLTDRAKDVIKSGGEWISSVDLENALMAHPEVLEASVVAIPDEKWEERPLACVVLRNGGSATPTELRDFLASTFAKWQLPDAWSFIDVVPKTSVGKFDKKVLRRQYAEGELSVVSATS